MILKVIGRGVGWFLLQDEWVIVVIVAVREGSILGTSEGFLGVEVN